MTNIAKKIALALVTVAVILLAAEVTLRLKEPRLPASPDSGRDPFIRLSPNELRKYEGVPNAKGHFWGTDIQLNSWGFRDREYAVKKPDGTYRVAVLGDSITFGNDLPNEDTYAYRLEKLFTDNKLSVEVINMGLGGYDTLQEVATLEEIGCNFEPDLVVLGYCMNDVVLASLNMRHVKKAQAQSPAPQGSRLLNWLSGKKERIENNREGKEADTEAAFQRNNKHLITDVTDDEELTDLMQQLKRELPRKKGAHRSARAYASPKRVGKLRYSLEKLKALQQKHDFEVIVMIVPYLNETRKNRAAYATAYEIVEHEVERAGFESVSIRDPFNHAGFESLLNEGKNAIHPNALGHEIMAEALYDRIHPRIARNSRKD